MLTAVFMCQPLGQLAATLVALIAIVRQRDGIPADSSLTHCTGDCQKTLDSVWRWIIGVGVIPAVIALWFRLTIIESPRYTADVGGDSRKAASELSRYLPALQDSTASASSVDMTSESQPLQRPNTLVASEDGTTLRDISGEISQSSPMNGGHLEDPPLENAEENKPPPVPSWKEFKQYFWHDGNLRTLTATSFCWFCVDL